MAISAEYSSLVSLDVNGDWLGQPDYDRWLFDQLTGDNPPLFVRVRTNVLFQSRPSVVTDILSLERFLRFWED